MGNRNSMYRDMYELENGYEIAKEDESYTVYRCGATVSKGFQDIESALHSIWVIEGKIKGEYYTFENNIVRKNK